MQDWVRLGRGAERTELQKRWKVTQSVGQILQEQLVICRLRKSCGVWDAVTFREPLVRSAELWAGAPASSGVSGLLLSFRLSVVSNSATPWTEEPGRQ